MHYHGAMLTSWGIFSIGISPTRQSQDSKLSTEVLLGKYFIGGRSKVAVSATKDRIELVK